MRQLNLTREDETYKGLRMGVILTQYPDGTIYGVVLDILDLGETVEQVRGSVALYRDDVLKLRDWLNDELQ